MSKMKNAQLIWDKNQQPISKQFDDVYFSRHNGLEETRYIFIQHNNLAQRFSTINKEQPVFTIGETGFGSGLNFLCTLQVFLKNAPHYARLHFISAEKYPLQNEDLDKALSLWPELVELKEALIAQYPPLFPGFYNLSFDNHRVRLTLLWGDATTQLSTLTGSYVDAWFLDGFAPQKNPDLWNDALIKQVTRLSKIGTTFSTFTAASDVRKKLINAGFEVIKTAGFANKREMLCGRWTQPPQPPTSKPWFQLAIPKPSVKKVTVIGGGLAGATTAWSLAKRGWQVTVIDKNNTIAQESSGNLQGVIYARLSAFNNTPNKFMVQAYQHSLNLLNSIYKNKHNDTWSPCGVLQLAFNDKEQKRFSELLNSQLYPHDILIPITANKASELVRTTISQNGIYFPHGGWVNPPSFCKDLVNHSSITVITNTEVTHLDFDESNKLWNLLDLNKKNITQTPVVIIANNANACSFEQTKNIPIKYIRGQITHLTSSTTSETINTVVCTERYFTPARHGIHSLGASFNLHDQTNAIRAEDHQANLDALHNSLPELYATLTKQPENQLTHLQGRVGFRAVTPDYMPIVGPVPTETQFIEDYAGLRKNANARIMTQGTYYPGLFINTAHGSKGLLSCPLSAELLASYINGEMLPLEKEVAELLHPARFIIKDLIRRLR